MSKKKLTVLISSALIVAAIGGSFAWFTASDSLTNHFTTAGVKDGDDKDDGVKIKENEEWTDPDGDGVYENEEAKNITPGTEVNKDVWTKNTAKYVSFIRVKLTPEFTNTKFIDLANADNNLLELTLANTTNTTDLEENKWVDGGDGYYYYLAPVDPDAETDKLLDAVTLSKDANNDYKNAEFDVKADAEGIQATNKAAASEWSTANAAVLEKLTSLEK